MWQFLVLPETLACDACPSAEATLADCFETTLAPIMIMSLVGIYWVRMPNMRVSGAGCCLILILH